MIDGRDEQFWNAYEPIVATLFGIVTDERAEQYRNAFVPILVILLGIVIDDKE